MSGSITDAVVLPLLGQVKELDKWRYLMNESTEIDCLRFIGRANNWADEGGITPTSELPAAKLAIGMRELAVR